MNLVGLSRVGSSLLKFDYLDFDQKFFETKLPNFCTGTQRKLKTARDCVNGSENFIIIIISWAIRIIFINNDK